MVRESGGMVPTIPLPGTGYFACACRRLFLGTLPVHDHFNMAPLGSCLITAYHRRFQNLSRNKIAFGEIRGLLQGLYRLSGSAILAVLDGSSSSSRALLRIRLLLGGFLLVLLSE